MALYIFPLISDGHYSTSPISSVFIRRHDFICSVSASKSICWLSTQHQYQKERIITLNMYKRIRFNILHNSKNVNFDVDPFYLLQIKKKFHFEVLQKSGLQSI